jgi:hypothetical protein
VLPATADAAVVSTVSADTLTITGDAAADRITLRPGEAGSLLVDTGSISSFDRATFSRISNPQRRRRRRDQDRR